MLNLMRADMYRLVRSKGMLIALAIIIGLVALVVFVFRVAPASGIITDEDVFTPVAANEMTGAMGAQLAFGAMNNMGFLFLAGLHIIAISVFSSGAIKNEVTASISRAKFYITKWLMCCFVSIALMVVYLALFILFASFVDGFGYWGSGYMQEVLTTFGLQLTLAIGLTSVGVFLSFITRRGGATDGLYIAFLLAPSFILALLDMAFEWAMDLAMYDMGFLFGIFANYQAQPTADIVQGVAIAAGWTVVTVVAGILLFRRAEIK